MSTRIDHCQWCGEGPHGARILTAKNGAWFVKPVKVVGKKPDGSYGEHEQPTWCDRRGKTYYEVGSRRFKAPTPKQIRDGLAKGLEKKDIYGDEIKLKVDTSICHITNVGTDNMPLWLCVYCRGEYLRKKASLERKEDKTLEMFAAPHNLAPKKQVARKEYDVHD